DNGTYKNNYIVHNGILDGREGNAILYAETFGNGTYENNYAYSTMAELAAVADFSAENGWSEYWSIANDEVLFGEE
ncbi:MAG: hypothetical protein IJD77_07440, partial [Clostridia bacterium]|nr:hypothetical protein [Clostridia bacterium]